ncbi:FAD-binding oxidoreductase [Thermogemmatispora sp.]|uniref:FAD-binding oxidoreductase n=1 Tax=Thermogemmatispora sp. TaxID=1968838 RepID=UPI00261EB862|nr:FAD-binding oxidoreductase [Thermogemmatispora sp.]
MSVSAKRRKFWGWGYEGDILGEEELTWLEGTWAAFFGVDQFEVTPPPVVEEIDLRPPRLTVPSALAAICTTEPYERLRHAYGASFPDSARAFARDFSHPPDVVAYPRAIQDITALLDWSYANDIVVIPFGGGTSVVGGVEPPVAAERVLTIDLTRMQRVLEIDERSQVALIEAGAAGPVLEEQLRPGGWTLRFFPQSFEFSTLGGWIATRAGGHFATLATHIDDLVEGIELVTPRGVIVSPRFPASGAGPDPQRLWLGSEGTLGLITRAWVRIGRRPRFRASASVCFEDFAKAVEAVRTIAQAGLYPANCRLLDPLESLGSGLGNGTQAFLILTFESADHALDPWLRRALELCADYGGVVESQASESGEGEGHRQGAAGRWRQRFLRMPWYREALTARGIISDTFETAVTWERFSHLYEQVRLATAQAIHEVTGKAGWVSCRLTHVYPDGAAAYFTFCALGRKTSLVEQFWEIKRVALSAVTEQGGTITHHHAVGRDHRPWYDRERPALFAEVLRAAKETLDPRWLLNPGVLLDPPVSLGVI